MKNSKPYLHYKKENNYYAFLFYALFPLMIYGWYKNGLLPFLNHDINWTLLFRPLMFPFFGFGAGVLCDLLIWWKSEKTTIWTEYPFYGLILGMIMPIQANPWFFLIILFLVFYGIRFIRKERRKNALPILSMVMLCLFCILGSVSFFNQSEIDHTLIYSLMDQFMGRSVGGVCTTSIFFSLIGYGILCCNYYYKKEIPCYILGTYVILCLIFEIFFPTGDLLKTMLNSSVVFASIFLGADMLSSPYMIEAQRLYGILIGMLGFFLIRFYSPILGIYISIFILSFFVFIFDQIASKLKRKNDNFCRMQKNKK